METVASGAGRGICACGQWISDVCDDADMYSPEDIQKDFAKHAMNPDRILPRTIGDVIVCFCAILFVILSYALTR